MNENVAFVKRAVDILGASVGLAVAAPLMPWIAVAIRIESPGPVLFSQERAGANPSPTRDGQFRTFRMWKFRTMCANAETGKAVFAERGDPRVTRVGRFLRKTRLDELPQFWNVLVGDMSLVGPRPERPELLAQLAAAIPCFEERTRFLKPGITGLAQVSLDYLGRMSAELPIAKYSSDLLNPFKLPEADGAIADDMRTKLLFDMAYAASLESLVTFVRVEASILIKTPLVMLRAQGR